MLPPPCTLAALAALAAPALGGDLLVVDPAAPPGTFATIQLAVDAAGDGDVVLVKGGTHQSFFVVGKGVDVVADAGATVRVTGGPRVADLPAGSRVLLHGLQVSGVASPTSFAGHGLTALDCDGALRLQDYGVVAADQPFVPTGCEGIGNGSGWEGATLERCADVVFVGCDLAAGDGMDLAARFGCAEVTPGGEGGHGVLALDSSVAVHRSALRGGDAGQGGFGGYGGSGYFDSSGTFFLADTLAVGGAGGQGNDFIVGPGGPGGDGVYTSPTTTGTVLDVLAAGGPGGPSLFGQPGAPGDPYGSFLPTALPGPSRSFDSPAPVRENTSVDLVFDGEPQDFGLVLIGAGDAALPFFAFQGLLHTAAPLVKALGPLGATGQRTFTLPVGPLPATDPAVVLPLQGVVLSSTLEIVLSTPRHQVIVEAGA